MSEVAGDAVKGANTGRPSVWFVTRKWPPAMGGMETYSVKLFEELERLTDARAVALPGNADGSVPSVRALLGWGWRTALKVTGVDFGPDIIHLGDMAIWPLGWFARFRKRTVRVVLSAHGTDVSYPARGGLKGRLYGAYLQFGARALKDATVIANSEATAEATRSFGFSDIQVIGLATEFRPPVDTEPTGDILFSGRLVRRKGLRWFVENVLPEVGGVRLRVAGTKWDDAEAGALNDPRVEYLGRLQPSDLATEYARALCVVVPNIDVPSGEFEGFGLVAAEAAAAGGIVLAAAHSGLKEAVLDGVTGFSLTPGDAVAWVRKIKEIQSLDRKARAAFVARSSEAAANHFTWERVARETFAVYGAAR